MADPVSPGWAELLATVRHRESGEPLAAADRQAALELATAVGLASLGGAVGCSITLLRAEGQFVTPAATGAVALLLDEVQYAQGDGPCIRAARTGRPEQLDSMAADGRWPALTRRAGEVGVRSSLSLPLPTATTPAALNLYAAAEGSLASARATAVASVIARATSTLLASPGVPVEGLDAARVHRAMGERTLISRAQGMLMVSDGISAELAYRRLALRSAVQDLPLRDVARGMLTAEGDAATESEAGSASSSGEDVSA